MIKHNKKKNEVHNVRARLHLQTIKGTYYI